MAVYQQRAYDPTQSAFVGRRQELQALADVLARAGAGSPQVVLVEGEAGIGKTALVERFLARAGAVTVLRGSGDESETDLAFGVIEQLLRRAGVAERGGDHVAVGARILDLLGT